MSDIQQMMENACSEFADNLITFLKSCSIDQLVELHLGIDTPKKRGRKPGKKPGRKPSKKTGKRRGRPPKK